MKREIKFRAWDTENEIWLNYIKLSCSGEMMTAGDGEMIPIQNPERVVIMQFTGLLDRLGKEIYEGDLIKHFDKGQISLVEWSSGDWGWYMKSVKNWNLKIGFDFSLDEVIGNIYENLELLKD